MTKVYFIRHAESDRTVRDSRIRPLTEKGLADRQLVTDFLHDKNIQAVFSSPFKRAIDTVSNFAGKHGHEITPVEDFRELKSASDLPRDSLGHPDLSFLERQWEDFSYRISDGETLEELCKRNITALNRVISQNKDKNIVVGTHAMALSVMINFYDKTYGFGDFLKMNPMLPYAVRMDFNEHGCIGMEKTDLFKPVTKLDYDNSVVRTSDFGRLKAYKYVVIFARYENKWLYCRASERDTFETAGGRIEEGETPLEAARREFMEETGAAKFDLKPAFDYAVHYPNVYANGQVFFAQVYELGKMPEYEMAEVKLFETFPDNMRFPKILPVLYERMQSCWEN